MDERTCFASNSISSSHRTPSAKEWQLQTAHFSSKIAWVPHPSHFHKELKYHVKASRSSYSALQIYQKPADSPLLTSPKIAPVNSKNCIAKYCKPCDTQEPVPNQFKHTQHQQVFKSEANSAGKPKQSPLVRYILSRDRKWRPLQCRNKHRKTVQNGIRTIDHSIKQHRIHN